ncbi:MAG: hypothetical protein ACLTYN_09950 [Dysosmobacter welbionis]
MKWQFSNDAPIYSQLIAQIKVGIVSGAFPPGRPFRAGPGYGGGVNPTPCSGPDERSGRTGIQPADHG